MFLIVEFIILGVSAILYVGTRRWLEFALPLTFAGADAVAGAVVSLGPASGS